MWLVLQVKVKKQLSCTCFVARAGYAGRMDMQKLLTLLLYPSSPNPSHQQCVVLGV